MGSSQETEITLGTGKLLVLFFGLVGMCALFFALGYSLGRKSEPGLPATNNAGVPTVSTSTSKASGSSSSAQSMTFYKNVEQKDANAELTPSADAKTSSTAAANPSPAQNNGVDPATTTPTSGYFVQVAAVSKQEDADALVDALKKREYPAFVAPVVGNDKLFHVQLGPYGDVKDAEGMRTKLIGDGYSPILKR